MVVPDGVFDGGSVQIQSGRITSVQKTTENARNAEALDLSGLTLFPGFIDVHIHGAVGVDVMDADVEGLVEIAKFLGRNGVTSWLPTFVPASDGEYAHAISVISRAQEMKTSGARILGVHYEGPFVNTAQCGALHQEYFKTYSSPDDLNSLVVPPASAKMITLAPEVNGGIELVSQLTKRGWVVSIGHTRATFELLNQAHSAGAKHMTHFMNAMAPLHHRSPGPIGWGMSRDDVTCDIIADGVHLNPEILKLLMKVKGSPGLSLISDSIAAVGKGDGEYQIWGETIAVREGRTSNSAGSIAGSVITMLDAVKMMRSLGASDVEVAQMAST
ncbi:MAG: N-acetylglucosamine-6-phosphate deacetylase, partial [Acidobacteria bacterium]